MITIEQWNGIENSSNFVAIDNLGEESRFCKESEEVVFKFAKKSRRYGWRLNRKYFLENYTLKVELSEEIKWKKRLKRVIQKLEKTGLWENVLEIYKNLYEFVSLEEKKRISREYWAKDNATEFLEQVKVKYPFMVRVSENGKEYLNTDYIWELSECRTKSMYFGKYDNTRIKEEIAQRLEKKESCMFSARVSYDVSFEYNAEYKRAWYSEEYKNCGNGHYYLAIDNTTAVYYEVD